ncbi:hypothetical protein [Maridesulfovibrio ferrireducens]|uniref:hypothetical protein n=1 Tax=Maridesulfovibrio ferrireducens TaxID=246191 RepID=UPI001A281E4E|nr:hypothetical protein [Maridesulfovibrio ferrireducens]MBI9112838.1 hypothetical protein [Maridesulfovibrio ferrireducens]
MSNMFASSILSMPDITCESLELRIKDPRQSVQDIVRKLDEVYMSSEFNPLPILEKLIPAGRKNGNIFSDGYISYVLKPFNECYREQESCYFSYGSMGQPQIRTRNVYHWSGEWWMEPYAYGCQPSYRNGILALTQHIKGCSYENAFVELARYGCIDIHQSSVRQIQRVSGFKFISDPYEVEYVGCIRHPVLGPPGWVYPFLNPYGRPSFSVCCWKKSSSREQVLLLRTCQHAGVQGGYRWEFVAPPASSIIFNLDRLYNKRDLPVRIYSDLHEAWRLKDSLEFISTWSGELSFCSEIDWKIIKGREVSYCYDTHSRVSMELGKRLYQRLQELGVNTNFINKGDIKCKAFLKSLSSGSSGSLNGIMV